MISKLYKSSHKIISSKVFLWISIAILVLTSCLVGYHGAVLQSFNFDQLIDNYMFDSFESFSQAVFPAAHTFILKWPIFALGGLMGNTQAAFVVITILVHLLTVLSLLAIVYVATKKNVTVTSLMACLMSLLFLIIPIQESPGTVAPIGIAMITTRNIEYIIYILAMCAFIRSSRFMDKFAVWGSVLMLLLAVSDKLLLYIALGSTVLWILYRLIKSKKFLISYTYPALYVVATALISSGIFKAINAFTTITINKESSSVSTVTHDSVNLLFTSSLDAIESIVRNFGATVFGVQPGLTLLIGLVGLIVAVLSVWVGIRMLVKNNTIDDVHLDTARLLVLSSLSALILYVVVARDDGIAVRYLGIFLFTGIFVIALWLSTLRLKKNHINQYVTNVMILILLLIPIATVQAIKRTDLSIHPTEQRLQIDQMKKIANVASERDIDVLVGIYYVVTLARYHSTEELIIAPTKDYVCTPEMTEYLTTRSWYEPTAHAASSALYVLEDKDKETVNGGCSVQKYTAILGQPVDVVSVGDSASLYLYDFDIRKKLFNED